MWGWLGVALLLGVVLGAVLVLAPPQQVERTGLPPSTTRSELMRDYTSFFTGSSLDGSGWGRCTEPITWSVDVSALPRDQRRPEVLRLTTAMLAWATASGLPIAYRGRQRLDYNRATHQLLPAEGGPLERRHIYVSFLREGVSPLLVGDVVGLAMPSRVVVPTHEVVGGDVILRAAFVRGGDADYPLLLRGLDLHEIGHAMALGHAKYVTNAMYPTIRTRTRLGLGDTQGAAAFLKACGA